MITYQDIAAQVENSLPAVGDPLREGIDVDAITAEIIATYGLVDIDDIDFDEYWAIVNRNDSTQV